MATELLTLARLSALAVTVLLLIWSIGFRSSFLHLSSTSSSLPTAHLDHLFFVSAHFYPSISPYHISLSFLLLFYFFSFQVLHPLLMVIGFILLSGEGSNLQLILTGVNWIMN